METTTSRQEEAFALEDELASLAAHLNAATARWLERLGALLETGTLAEGETARWVAFRFGVPLREARELVRVSEALKKLPAIRDAFAHGELTLCKVRALSRVATPTSEEGLLELARALTASQLERALRAFRRLAAEEAREAHELEYVDYHFAEDGSLYLRARLPAEDGTLLVKALEAARERVRARRRKERRESEASAAGTAKGEPAALAFEPARSARVEALVELARSATSSSQETGCERARLVVHVDAAWLGGERAGQCELEDGPVLSLETARRLGCDAETLVQLEQDGIPLALGRTRRTVSPKLRRALEARDEGTCRWPGCEQERHLEAHHKTHWAKGGETSLENLVLLCWHHHRLVHEGGYTIEDDSSGGLRFRNRHGVLHPSVPSRSPPGSLEELLTEHERLGIEVDPSTNRNGHGDPLDLALAVDAIQHVLAA